MSVYDLLALAQRPSRIFYLEILRIHHLERKYDCSLIELTVKLMGN